MKPCTYCYCDELVLTGSCIHLLKVLYKLLIQMLLIYGTWLGIIRSSKEVCSLFYCYLLINCFQLLGSVD